MYIRVFVANIFIGAKYGAAPVISSTHHSWEARTIIMSYTMKHWYKTNYPNDVQNYL